MKEQLELFIPAVCLTNATLVACWFHQRIGLLSFLLQAHKLGSSLAFPEASLWV